MLLAGGATRLRPDIELPARAIRRKERRLVCVDVKKDAADCDVKDTRKPLA